MILSIVIHIVNQRDCWFVMKYTNVENSWFFVTQNNSYYAGCVCVTEIQISRLNKFILHFKYA